MKIASTKETTKGCIQNHQCTFSSAELSVIEVADHAAVDLTSKKTV